MRPRTIPSSARATTAMVPAHGWSASNASLITSLVDAAIKTINRVIMHPGFFRIPSSESSSTIAYTPLEIPSPDDPFLLELSGLSVGEADDNLVSFDRLDLDLSVRWQPDDIAGADACLVLLLVEGEEQADEIRVG